VDLKSRVRLQAVPPFTRRVSLPLSSFPFSPTEFLNPPLGVTA